MFRRRPRRVLCPSGPQGEEEGQAGEEPRLLVLATPGRSPCWSLKHGMQRGECQP